MLTLCLHCWGGGGKITESDHLSAVIQRENILRITKGKTLGTLCAEGFVNHGIALVRKARRWEGRVGASMGMNVVKQDC